MRPTRDGNGTGNATCAGWERELLGSVWNGNYKQRGMGMGNNGVYTEWEREREWEFEREREREWGFEREQEREREFERE